MFGQSWQISVLAVEGLHDVELSERDSHLFVRGALGFSVFGLENCGFSVLVFHAVCRYSPI